MLVAMLIARAALVLLVVAGCGRDKPAEARDKAHGEAHAEPRAEAPPAPGNAVQNEMRLLTEAMRDTVSAIGTGDLAPIPHRLHEVHKARDLTEQAIASGTYKLPRNGENVAACKALDESFHAELEKLFLAARANDPAATSAAFSSVMSRCDGCHAQFRAPK